MFRARYLVIPSFVAILMACSTLNKQSWVRYHMGSTGPDQGYVTDWTMGLWRICVEAKNVNCSTMQYAPSCEHNILDTRCPPKLDGSLEGFKQPDGDMCFSWMITCKSLLITGICLHGLSQIAIMIEKPGSSRNSPKIWTAFGIATLISVTLEIAGLAHYVERSQNGIQLPDGSHEFEVDTYVFVILGLSVGITLCLAVACFARAIYLRTHKKEIDSATSRSEENEVRTSTLHDLRYLAAPLPIRRGSSQGSMILNVRSLAAHSLDMEAPPSYNEAMSSICTPPSYSYSSDYSSSMTTLSSSDGPSDGPYSYAEVFPDQRVQDSSQELTGQSFSASVVRFRTDSSGADAISIISDTEATC